MKHGEKTLNESRARRLSVRVRMLLYLRGELQTAHRKMEGRLLTSKGLLFRSVQVGCETRPRCQTNWHDRKLHRRVPQSEELVSGLT